MAKPGIIPLDDRTGMPILYEDAAVLAVDKPAGWLVAPESWTKTSRNLQLVLREAIAEGQFWVRSRHIRFLRFIHRLDADTSGILLLAKSPGALTAYSRMFEARGMEKTYLAVVRGTPRDQEWICRQPLAPHPTIVGKMTPDPRYGKLAETRFRVLESHEGNALVEASPLTGRTHQIRAHLAASGHPILGDRLYGVILAGGGAGREADLALRAIALQFIDPFRHKPVRIHADRTEFLRQYWKAPPPATTISR